MILCKNLAIHTVTIFFISCFADCWSEIIHDSKKSFRRNQKKVINSYRRAMLTPNASKKWIMVYNAAVFGLHCLHRNLNFLIKKLSTNIRLRRTDQ